MYVKETKTHIPTYCFIFYRIVGLSHHSLMVGPGEPAQFECGSDARPMTDSTIRWERVGGPYDNDDGGPYAMSSRTHTAKGAPGAAMLALSRGSPHVSVLMLTVVNATAEDTGAFACVADNGVGRAERNTTYLLVRREYRNWALFKDVVPVLSPLGEKKMSLLF